MERELLVFYGGARREAFFLLAQADGEQIQPRAPSTSA